MMNRVQRIGCLAALMIAPAFFSSVIADEKAPPAQQKETKKLTKEEVFSPQNIARISESYGHFIYKSLDNPILKLDFAGVVKGMNDAKAGKPSPMTEQEYEEGIAAIQEIAFQEMSEKNLKDAETFLAKNEKEPGVVDLEKGKLQIKVLQPGTGEELIEGKMPVLHYTGKYLDGTVFGNSYTNGEPISISLSHTIPGFRQGVMGMKVGEKRRIFIHPSLGYGTSGQLLPNSLLIFDIELVKVEQAPKDDMDDSTADDDEDDDEDDDDVADDDDYDDDDDDDDSDDDDAVVTQPKK
jgi:peptidylprolyl isomerase